MRKRYNTVSGVQNHPENISRHSERKRSHFKSVGVVSYQVSEVAKDEEKTIEFWNAVVIDD